MRARIVTMLAIGLLLAGCGGSDSSGSGGWKTYGASEGGFSIAAPTQPTRREDTLQTAAGRLPSVAYAYAGPQGTAYGVDYADYPAEIARRYDPNTILDAARDALLVKTGGQLIGEAPVTVQGAPGRDLHGADAAGPVRARAARAGRAAPVSDRGGRPRRADGGAGGRALPRLIQAPQPLSRAAGTRCLGAPARPGTPPDNARHRCGQDRTGQGRRSRSSRVRWCSMEGALNFPLASRRIAPIVGPTSSRGPSAFSRTASSRFTCRGVASQ